MENSQIITKTEKSRYNISGYYLATQRKILNNQLKIMENAYQWEQELGMAMVGIEAVGEIMGGFCYRSPGTI